MDARRAEAASSSSASAPGATRRAFAKSSGVFASATTRSGSRTPNAVSSRASNSTRSKLPSPRSRSSRDAPFSIGKAPRLPSSSSRLRMSSRTRSRTSEASSCIAGVATDHTKHAKDDFASARGYHAGMPFAINASGFLLDGLRPKTRLWRTSHGALLFALGDDKTVVSRLEAVLARRLIFRTVIPGLGCIVSRKLENDDLLDGGSFQNFMTPVKGAKNDWVLLKTRRSELFVLLHLGLVAGPFARDDDVSGHFFSSAASIR